MTLLENQIIHSEVLKHSGPIIEVSPEDAGWDFVGLRVIRIDAGDFWNYSTGNDEVCLVPLSGKATVEAADRTWEIGREGGIFKGKPTALYLPRESSFTVTATEDSELAITSSRATKSYPPKLIIPDEIDVEIRGAGNAARQINHIIKPDFPADTLLVVEVYTPSGNWSSYPPHKHDVSRMPAESKLEEIYYYRIDPAEGFGLQRLYAGDGSFDFAWVIKDGDLMLVPKGYHAFAVAHGYTAYYLNILAGDEPVRTMQPADDPAYGWVRETWTEDKVEGISDWRKIDASVNHGAGQRGKS
ncbi:MAG: 5-deoxy-glucuronate isomerase [Thermomicrobiales bacterium]